ncbi:MULTISPECIES: hypothetical protein [unclassified Sphingomonas]|uniref:hypothetical protein n=1 Tax=unclassified Sphingomonas TaxID=196159 RepID=UPI0006F47288|nr:MULTISPECIES: hypothetical protein [unclassified Sphingomonas]KQX20289.1 hypothetical protein ASD17_10525 [Sphingomonas sp. Root1294]KQY67539.1 hypothetical protein ASD39_10585 [Sphingomonas sp. Root50]KRB90916.1 hypothetical protein ASE22_11590 [Sphingomonas sp. Root720]
MDNGVGRSSWSDRALFCALLVGATLASMAATGFRFGVNNNVFHIPYVLDYAGLPQFRDDPVYRSLDKFVSLAWPAVRLVSTEANVRAVFLVGLVLGRLAAIAAFLCFFRLNGLSGRWALVAAMAVVSATPWLAQLAVIGGHGLFIGYFTHSELSWGPLLGALLAVQRGRLALAGLLCGIVFCLNFFVGLWLLAAIAPPVLASVRGWPIPAFLSRLAPMAPVGPAMIGRALLVFLLTASPVIVWVASTLLETRSAPPFDYAAYLRLYFPDHSLIDAAPATERLELALVFAAYVLAALLSRGARFWTLVLAGWSLLFVLGAAGPYLVDSKLLFNLNAVRSAGFVQFVGFGLVILAAIRAATDGGSRDWERLAGCLVLAELVQPDRQVFQLLTVDLLLAALLAFRHRPSSLSVPLLVVGYAALVVLILVTQFSAAAGWSPTVLLRLVLLFALGGSLLRGWRPLAMGLVAGLALLNVATLVKWRADGMAKRTEAERPFRQMVDWVRHGTLAGPFLVPVDKDHRDLFDDFQLLTLRPVWVDWKQGAVVMWEPAFYRRWSSRYAAVKGFRRAEQYLAYAAANGIPFVVLPEDVGGCGASRTLYRRDGYSICAPVPAAVPVSARR